MSRSAPKEWVKYKVGKPSEYARGFNQDCKPLVTVSHVAHVPTAVRILEDERIQSGLVFDQSKLRTERIPVIWLSPNDRNDGFRYGNVRFTIPWKSLLSHCRAYWVETVDYQPSACRILLTKYDHSDNLAEYDPTAGDGPWWVDENDNHYWNGNICLEIMLEEAIPIGDELEIDFVSHHPKGCCIDPKTCPYRGVDASAAGAEFVSTLVSRGLPLDFPGLIEANDGAATPSICLNGAVYEILARVSKACPEQRGSIIATDPRAEPLARAVLASIGNPAIRADGGPLASHFKDLDSMKAAIADVIASAAGLADGATFLEGRNFPI
jgi:hypothetical protein